jgi:hypothetical protein
MHEMSFEIVVHCSTYSWLSISCFLPDDAGPTCRRSCFIRPAQLRSVDRDLFSKFFSLDVNWIRDGGWSCLSIYASSIPSADKQPALQNNAT